MLLDLIGQDIDEQLARMRLGETKLWRVYWVRTALGGAPRSTFVGEIFAPVKWVAHDDACRVFGAQTWNERRAIWVGETAPYNRTVLQPTPDTPGIRRTERIDRKSGALSHWQVARVKACILRRLGEQVSLRDICDELEIRSRPYLVRGFLAHTGMTPYQWQLARRMDRAKALLVGTTLPVDRIGELVGYTDRTSFARTFKRETGGSARAWRKTRATPAPEALPPPRYEDHARRRLLRHHWDRKLFDRRA